MLKINKQSITLTKGDDASLRLVPRYKDKTIYTVQEGDSAIFRLKVGASVKELECVLNLENNKIVVNFTPADTKDFEPGIYRYEAELITSLGFHYTFIADQPFILGNEIEQRLSNATSANGNSNGNYPEIDGEIGDEPVVNGDIQPTNPMMDYEELNHLPKLNGKTIKGDKDNAYYGIPTKLSEMDNDDNYVQDADYQHTDNNFSDEYKGVLDNLGTASGYDVPVSGNAGNDEVVLGNDTRLSDARPASDVSSWAKAPNKPTYSASEVGAIPSTDKGSANGVAELDTNGKVPSAQLPAYVDDVLEYASVSAFPETGESGKIYIALDTNKTYRWGGSAYAEISESLALGETSSTAYRGDKGKTAYDHATETKLSTATASGLYKVASTAQGHIAGLTPVEKTDITALGIPAQDTTYNDATTSASGLMSANDKTKLNGIASGAQVNVQSDFAQTDTEADDFIKNKPTKVSDFTNDSGFTKVESSTTNGNIKINGTETQVYDDSEIKGELTTDETTIEGNPLNFSTKSAQTAQSTIIDLEPIQDLHGYDKPWVGGAGKNKLPLTLSEIKSNNSHGTWNGNVFTSNRGITFTILTDSDDNVIGIKVNGQPSENEIFALCDRHYFDANTYILNGCPSSGGTETLRIDIRSDNTGVQIVDTGNGGTGTLSNSELYRGVIRVGANVNINNQILYPMLRLSTESDATFQPYKNECPISGRTQVGILGCGKNLFDKTKITSGKRLGDSGEEVSDSDCYISDYIPVLADTYTKNSPITDYRHRLCIYDSSKDFVARYSSNTLTFNETAKYIRFCGYLTELDSAQFEKNNQSTRYTAYQSSTDLTISLGQTVYGGTLDVENGVLVVDRGVVDLANCEWTYDSQYNRFVSKRFTDVVQVGTPRKLAYLCSCYETITDERSFANVPPYCTYSAYDGQGTMFYNHDARYTDATTYISAVSGEKICYPLKTPITIQLTPHQISLLEDVNNISTTGDKITLTYRDGKVATLGDLKEAVDEMSAKLHTYSTSEQVVGTWIDGKPIYEKTVDMGAMTTGYGEFPHNIANIDNIVSYQFVGKRSNASGGWFDNNSVGNDILITVNTTNVYRGANSIAWEQSYLTIQYTKTTDS